MSGKTHFFGGLLAGAAAAAVIKHYYSINPEGIIISIGTAVLGGIMPDIDTTKSKVKIPVLSSIIKMIFGHRSLFHSPFFYVVLSFLFFFFIPWTKLYCVTFLCGAMSHLLLDMLNKKGIPLLYPFSKKHFHFCALQSAGIADFSIRILIIFFAVSTIWLYIL